MLTPSPVLAAFDLDFTLLDNDSEIMWLEFVYHERLAEAAYLRKLEAYFGDDEKEDLPIDKFQQLMIHPLTLHPWDELISLRGRFLQRIPEVIRPEMMMRVAWHRGQGHTVLLATAANAFIAEPIAEMLAFENVLSTQIERDGLRFTGSLSGLSPFQEGKAILVREWAESHGISLAGSWGYSDSHNDIPLLNLVDNPVAVTPSPRLRAYALERCWQIME